MARYGDFTTPIQMVKPLQTKDTLEYKQCRDLVVAAEVRWGQAHKRVIHVNAGEAEGTWQIEIGYEVGPEFLTYRKIIARSWTDAERVVENHTRRYRGDITVCGFEMPKVDNDTLK